MTDILSRGNLIVCAAGDESSGDDEEDGMVREVRGGVEYSFGTRPRLADEGVEEDGGSGLEDEGVGRRYVALYQINVGKGSYQSVASGGALQLRRELVSKLLVNL